MKGVERSPARLSGLVAVSAALVAFGSGGFYSWAALAAGAVGFALVVLGLVRGRTAHLTLGAFGLFAGAVVAGVRGAPVLPVLVGVGAAVLAWDVGGNAVSIGKQLGRDADTTRVEVVHASASVGVAALTTGLGYGLYRSAAGGQPVAALVFLLTAAVLLVSALD